MDIPLPQFDDEEYKAHFDEEGVDQDLVKIEYNLLLLTRDSKSKSLPPHYIAWHILWYNAFNVTRGARAALGLNSVFTVKALRRIIFELGQITDCIIRETRVDHSEDVSRENIKDRLSAYFAWCLWQDIRYYEHFLEGRYQNLLWDERPAREMAQDPAALKLHESIYGPREIMSDKELNEMRDEQRVRHWKLVDKLKKMAQHRDVSKWLEKIDDNWGVEYTYRSFFQLLEMKEIGMAKMLKEKEMTLFYPEYESGSQLLHCSTFAQLFYPSESQIIPKISNAEDYIRSEVDKASILCKMAYVNLKLIQNYINTD